MIKSLTQFNFQSTISNRYIPVNRSTLRFRSEFSPIPRKFTPIRIRFCAREASLECAEGNDTSDSEIAESSGEQSVEAATWIAVATLTNKILGLLREATMASVFGLGSVATAFKYAWVLPGFSSTLLGGLNGPIHIIMATTLSKLSEERGKRLFRHMSIIMFLVGSFLGAFVYIFPEFIIHLYAPGLWILAEGRIIREIAIEQLKLMTPCIVLAGPIGLGFGYMSAGGNNILPSLSPALSSSILVATCLVCTFARRLNASFSGGNLVSAAVSIGIFIQWIIQVIVLRKCWRPAAPDSFINIFNSSDVCEFFSLLLPATVSSGFAQIASFMDLCFASMIPGAAAAAGLSYAYVMVMSPLGALSTIILLPLVPIFSRLAKTSSWESILDNIRSAVLLCMVIVLPISSTMCILAKPIIRMVFERFAFDSSASVLVSALFLGYSLGAPFFIVRDLLVAVFYALGDGKRPFLVSAGALALNAILDWLVVSRLNLGAEGLALTTSFTAAVSAILLFHLLQKKLSGASDYAGMIYPTVLLLLCCITSNLSTYMGHKLILELLHSTALSRHHFVKELLAISLAGAVGIISFFIPVMFLHLLGVELIRDLCSMLSKQQSLRPMAKLFSNLNR